jgi:ribosomal protein L37AE/L43A
MRHLKHFENFQLNNFCKSCDKDINNPLNYKDSWYCNECGLILYDGDYHDSETLQYHDHQFHPRFRKK